MKEIWNRITGGIHGSTLLRVAIILILAFLMMLLRIFLVGNGMADGWIWNILLNLLSFGLLCAGFVFFLFPDLSEYRSRLQNLENNRRGSEKSLQGAEQESQRNAGVLGSVGQAMKHPLSGLIGMSEVLSSTQLDAKQADCVRMINQSSETLLALANKISDFSDIQSGKIRLDVSDMSVEELLEIVVEQVIELAAAKELDVIYSIDPALPPYVKADGTRLQQLLGNLLSNAVKFTIRGQIRITASSRTEGNQSLLRFEVRDTGIGMDEAELPGLFHTSKNNGIGLVMCERLVALMNGRIGCDSKSGVGSAFWFELPLVVGAATARTHEKVVGARLTGCSALVIDPDPDALKILKMHMANWGMVSFVYDVPQKALETLDSGIKYDVVLLGRDIPEISAADFARKISGMAGRDKPPIILMTPQVDPRLQNFDTDTPFQGQLIKPVRVAELRQILGQAMALNPQRKKVTSRVTVKFEKMSREYPLEILLVDDNEGYQRIVEHLLKRLGYKPKIVGSGLHAVDAARQEPFDVILMDVEMPNMDGLEAARLIRKHLPANKHPYIIALTENALHGHGAEVDEFLFKSSKLSELEEVLLRFCARRDGTLVEAEEVLPEEKIDALRLERVYVYNENEFENLRREFISQTEEGLSAFKEKAAGNDLEAFKSLTTELSQRTHKWGIPGLSATLKELSEWEQLPDGALAETWGRHLQARWNSALLPLQAWEPPQRREEDLLRLSKLEDISGGWNEAFCGELKSFVSDLPATLKKLNRLCLEQNRQEALELAGQLKECCSHYGFAFLSGIFTQLESACGDADTLLTYPSELNVVTEHTLQVLYRRVPVFAAFMAAD